jgi:hypothetical protein
MTECVPFLKVPSIGETINWYQEIGFKCTATNQIWEPDCELNWAEIAWDNATFMIGIDEGKGVSGGKDASIWFNVDTVDPIIQMLERKNIKMFIEPATFYGRKVVSFTDINGFDVSFSCALPG